MPDMIKQILAVEESVFVLEELLPGEYYYIFVSQLTKW